MASKITISNKDYVLIDESGANDGYYIVWADIGSSMPALSSTVHYVIWDGSKGEVQYNDGTQNLDLSASSDAVGSTTIDALLSWSETRKGELNTAQYNSDLAYWNSWDRVRHERGAILESTDWTQVGDSALDSSAKTAWSTYRTKIRDIPSTYSSTEPKLIKFAENGNVEIGTGLEEGTLNVTGASVVITSP